MKNNIEDYLHDPSPESIRLHKRIDKSQPYSEKSFGISLRILDMCKEQGIELSDLQERLGISKRRMNLMVRGMYDFTLSEICNIENELTRKIIEVK